MQRGSFLKFPPVLYARYRVGRLFPEQIDEMLAHGWFRNDLSVYAASARFMGDDWRSCVMLRLPLEHFTWKKRLAKLLRRNGETFETRIEPFYPSAEKNALWNKFKQTIHHWVHIPDLDVHLFRGALPSDFQSWEVCVYHKGRLVAFSIFDHGKESIASLEAAYDPDYRSHSLGLYTMLLEIEYGLNKGLLFYYPGFLPKDVSMFEYKLRPGGLEFYRLQEQRWLPWDAVEEDDWLYDEMVLRLNELKEIFEKKKFFTNLGYGFHHWEPANCVTAARYNVFLVVKSAANSRHWNYLVAWDPLERQYFLFSAQPQTGMMMPKTPGRRPVVRLFDISNHHFIVASTEIETIAGVVEYKKEPDPYTNRR